MASSGWRHRRWILGHRRNFPACLISEYGFYTEIEIFIQILDCRLCNILQVHILSRNSIINVFTKFINKMLIALSFNDRLLDFGEISHKILLLKTIF